MDKTECSIYITAVFDDAEASIQMSTQAAIDNLCGEDLWRDHLNRLRQPGY